MANTVKPYRDAFGNLLSKKDVEAATRVIVRHGTGSPSLLQRTFKWGYVKASRTINLLADAGVLGEVTAKPRVVILKNEDTAVNAALRQLKKGRQS